MDLVVKDNLLINASYNLELTEQRIILLAIVMARETGLGIDANTYMKIHADDYIKKFNVSRNSAYEALKNAVNNLFERRFSFEKDDNGDKKVVRSRWVSRIAYTDNTATIEIAFAPDVVPLITRLEKKFTSYRIKQITYLTSKYAVRLYEFLMSWQIVKKTPMTTIEELRKILGLETHEYSLMTNFKSRVLAFSVDQINEYTDINVLCNQFKKGRSIIGFEFIIDYKNKDLEKNKSDRETLIDTPIKLTTKQINFFAHKLAYDDVFASKYAEIGEEYNDLEQRLNKNLTDINFIKEYLTDLERVGFKIT